MTELSGTLEGVGLPPILRFLGVLKKSGTLRLTHHEWNGDVFFADGQVTGASLGSHTGLEALDALVEALPGAHFEFDSQAGDGGEPSIRLSWEALQIHLDDLSRRLEAGLRNFPAIAAVPSLVVHDETSEAGEDVLPLDRGTLQTLLGVDGLRSVREIVAQRGTLDSLWQLATLIEVGLIEIRGREEPSHALESPVEVEPEPEPLARPAEAVPQPAPPPPPFAPPIFESSVEATEATAHCPKLGFEDDPANSFSRPTRLHRCFASGTPMPLSIDQQRELCLSSQFGTCPRLGSVPTDGPAEDDPRIVRLPFVSRAAAAQRAAAASGGMMHEPTRLRAARGTVNDDPVEQPTPLRARLERAAATTGSIGASAVADPPAAVDGEALRNSRPAEARERPVREVAALVEPAERRFAGIPVGAIVGVVAALAVIATIALLLLPQMDSLFNDDSIDTAALPNSSLVAAGTPVSVIAGKANPTPDVASASGAAALQAQAQATPEARPSQVPLQPTAVPAPANSMFLDEHFQNNDAGWPSSSLGPATVINGVYRVATRLAGQFVAIGAPIVGLPADVSVSAGFRKLGGPAGGGYGIIVRDQGPGPRDGASQEGRYYVLEIGDKGEIGIWRRDADHWVDLLSWQHSDAVKPGTAPNDLTVKAVGNTLSMTVNGTQVATKTDAALSGGTVGLFVGGDGNQVLVDHFAVQTP